MNGSSIEDRPGSPSEPAPDRLGSGMEREGNRPASPERDGSDPRRSFGKEAYGGPRGPWERVGTGEIGLWAAYTWARLGEHLARALPSAWAPPIVAALRFLYGKLSRRRMLMMRLHLEKIVGPMGREELSRRMRRARALYARYWYETFRLPAMTKEEVRSRVRALNEGAIQRALAANKGAVLALPHLGNWDFAGSYIAGKYGPVLAVAELLRPRRAFEHWKATRERLGLRIVPLDGTSAPAKEAIRHLRSGGIVALVADRWIAGAGVVVEFFGEKTLVPAGPATLARRTGAPLLPVGLYMEDDGMHLGVVEDPIDVPETTNSRADVEVATQRLVRVFERLIARDPEQWHLFTPFWPSDWRALGLKPPFQM